MVTPGIEDQNIGIIGLGRTGARIAEMLQVFRPASISYYSRNPKPDVAERLGLEQKELTDVLGQSDITFICITGDETTWDYMDAEKLAAVKQDALLVSFMHPGVINAEALLDALKQRRFRAISDWPLGDEFNELPMSHWYSMNASNTITTSGVQLFSDTAVTSMLNLLENGKDQNRVN